jgi:hypothetical protein
LNTPEAPKGVEGKRKSKRESKKFEEIQADAEAIVQISSICSEELSQTQQDGSSSFEDGDSEYSYSEKSNTKLFNVTKVVKNKPMLKKKVADVNKVPLVQPRKNAELRKDSIVTNISGCLTNAASPVKLSPRSTFTTPVHREELSQPKAVVGDFDQKHTSNNSSYRNQLKRGVSVSILPSEQMVDIEEEEDIGCVNKNSSEFNELG